MKSTLFPAEAATLTQIIADMSSFKRDCIEKGGLTIPVNGQVIPGEESKLSDHLVSHSDAGSHSLSVVPPPPAYEQQENINDSKVQRIKFHNYFPSSTDAKDSSKEIRNTGWQASTPIKTRDDVRIEHILNLLVKYVTKGGQEEPREIKMTAPIALVTVSPPARSPFELELNLNTTTNFATGDIPHRGPSVAQVYHQDSH